MKISISNLRNKILEVFDSNKTNAAKDENAVSYAESPLTYDYDMFSVATDRYNIIKEVNLLCGENGDIRFQRANYLIAEDATKGGFSIVVHGSEKDRKQKVKMGKGLQRLTPGTNYAQNVIDDFIKRTKLNVLCNEHAAALLREGDIFLNVVVDLNAKLVLQVKRAPVLTMKRNSDEYGEFKDIEKAFSQIDPITDMHYFMSSAPPRKSRENFALYQMNHIRWLSDETKIYGRSQYAVARKAYRKLEEMEKSLAYRRMFRSVSKRAHKLENSSDPKDIAEYRRNNAMVDMNNNPTKNAHLLSDFVGNVEIKSLNDEANLDQIKDVELMENALWINLLVPKAILTGGQGINRDVLKVQYPHYLQSLNNITDHLEYGDSFMYSGYRSIIDLQLLLAGINPDSIQYDMVWSQKTFDELIDKVEAIQGALGKGGGKQIITIEKAIQLMANEFDIEDTREMYAKLLEENSKVTADKMTDFANKAIDDQVKNSLSNAIVDEHKADESEIDNLVNSFTDYLNSFFEAVYNKMADSSQSFALNDENLDGNSKLNDDIEGKFNFAWNTCLNQYIEAYINHLAEAGVLGKKRGKTLLKSAQEYKFGTADANLLAKIRIEKPEITEDLLKASGTRIKGMNKTTLKSIRSILDDGFDTSMGWQSIMEQIAPIIKNRNRAEMIARTELSWAYNRNTLKSYTEAEVWHVIWDATLDMGVCKGCTNLHGKVYFIHDCPEMPHHPRCRCAWLPYL